MINNVWQMLLCFYQSLSYEAKVSVDKKYNHCEVNTLGPSCIISTVK
jgi:hypothetical protein